MLLSIAREVNRFAGTVMSNCPITLNCPGEVLKFFMLSGVPITSLSSFDER
jgi:hypothetical protein